MSQEQPRRPSGQPQQQAAGVEQGAVRYSDVFPAVSGGLAEKPVAPQDAATMQSAESLMLGQTLRGGPAAAMQSAATANERMGVVGHDQATDATAVQGVTVSETRVPGGRLVTEFVAGQAVGQYLARDDASATAGGAGVGARGEARGGGGAAGLVDNTKVTIGEALEATALAAGDEPVERSDAAAIQAAEARATGLDVNVPGGLAAQAQSAAAANAWAARDQDKTTLGDVLANATAKLVGDKPVESADALRVAGAENRNKGDGTARPGGVAASLAAAARLNRDEAVWEQ
ncbi:unnamed protein product [Urochloa decumbens]|uniref:SMP domain-containing protein n=1 Tax=Urochloa decumbens TaxID=240449 RepID=A0ABC8XNL5_9POAL